MQRSLSTPETYAGVLSLCILGYLLNRLFVLVQGAAMARPQGVAAKRL